MNLLAYKIVSAIKKNNPEQTHSIEVMQYSLSIILNTLFIILCSLLIGGFTGQFKATSLALLSFGVLRLCSGGAHLKTATACNIVSIFICSLIPHIALLLHNYHLVAINIICLVLMLIFAPNPDANAQIPKEWFLGLKFLSVLMIVLNFWIHSSVIGLAFFIQSLTVIIPFRRRSRK